MSVRTIEFDDLPFGFDASGRIRCAKCGDAGWRVDGAQSGLSFAEKQGLHPARVGNRLALPKSWSRSGKFDTSAVQMDAWLTVLEQNVEQVRHVDNMRMKLMAVYGGLSAVAGGVSFISDLDGYTQSFIFLGIAGVTLIQYFIHGKLGQAFEHNMDHVRLLLAIAPNGAQFAQLGLFRQMKGMIVRGEWSERRMLSLVPRLYLVIIAFWLAAAIRAVVLETIGN